MSDQVVQISNIAKGPAVRKARVFSSVVSATAFISLFVVFSVQLLGRI